MKIWEEDYQVIPEDDKQQWEELKKKEIVQYLGSLPVTKSLYREYPKSVRQMALMNTSPPPFHCQAT